MRSAGQIGRTVKEWQDYQARERERNLSSFLRMCQQARERGEEWIAWIDAGCPDVTTPEGAPFATPRATSRRAAQPGALL